MPAQNFDWDAALIVEPDVPIEDSQLRPVGANRQTYAESQSVRLPNCCGWIYSVAFVTFNDTGEFKYVYLRRYAVGSWCLFRRPFPYFPSNVLATVGGSASGRGLLVFNGRWLGGLVNTDLGPLYLRQGCHFGTGAACNEPGEGDNGAVGLEGSIDNVTYTPAVTSGMFCSCIPWHFIGYSFGLYGSTTVEIIE